MEKCSKNVIVVSFLTGSVRKTHVFILYTVRIKHVNFDCILYSVKLLVLPTSKNHMIVKKKKHLTIELMSAKFIALFMYLSLFLFLYLSLSHFTNSNLGIIFVLKFLGN